MLGIITQKRLREYTEQYPTAKASLLHWEKTVLAASWSNPADLKQTFNNVDAVKVASGNTVQVFNLERNAHRLVAAIHFNTGMVFVLLVITHKGYDQEYW